MVSGMVVLSAEAGTLVNLNLIVSETISWDWLAAKWDAVTVAMVSKRSRAVWAE